MDSQVSWLHHEGSYRAYIRGLRFALLGFAVCGAFGALAASAVVGEPVPLAGLLIAFAFTIAAILTAIIGWLAVPDKNRARRHQQALLRLVAHDIFRGLPPRRDTAAPHRR